MTNASASQRPVVLVVDDEPVLRMHAIDIVTDAGFEALEAANADEAIAMLRTRNDIRVVFADIQMPGSMDGLKLAHAIRERWPPVDLIVTSGRARPGPDELPTRGIFLSKPYTSTEVSRALSRFVH